MCQIRCSCSKNNLMKNARRLKKIVEGHCFCFDRATDPSLREILVRRMLRYIVEPNGLSEIDDALVLGFEFGMTF